MLSARVHGYGQPLLIEEIPVPSPGPGEVLVQVRASAVNPVDWKIAGGHLRGMMEHAMPLTPGIEASGVVSAAGPGAAFAVGDEVYGYWSLFRNGGYAEYALADSTELAAKPAALSFAQAAAIPVALFTALDGLEQQATLAKGQKVLVLGGAGGVGAMAIQVAKRHGTIVYATASTRNQDRLRELGADHALDYTASQLPPEPVDVIFDAVGGDAAIAAAPALRPGGLFVSPTYAQVPGAKHYNILPDGARLAAYPVETLKVHIDREYPLAQAADAFAYSQSGRARGKIILVP
jgi:NADPH:quinone reductase-like Zn-dependent oxidoreductase